MNKKILSMLLAIIMLMTNIDITVLAAEMKETVKSISEIQVEKVEEESNPSLNNNEEENLETQEIEIETFYSNDEKVKIISEDMELESAQDGEWEIVDMGECGDELTWTLDSRNVLTISGTGDMWDYASDELGPWNESISSISGKYTLQIEEGVTSIGDYAFRSRYLSEELKIPNTVTRIGDYAFSYCSGFTGDLELPESVTEIGANAFSGCTGFKGAILTKNIEQIGNSAFNNFGNGTGELVIPEGITEIGSGAFKNANFTGELEIPQSVTNIGASAFEGCNFVGDLNIPEGVTNIGSSAFLDCSNFNGKLTLPSSMEKIGDYAFKGCGFSGDLIIPEKIIKIGLETFYNCTGFTGKLVLPEKLEEIRGSAFYGCSGLSGELILPNGITRMDSYAFSGCSGLSGDLVIPEGVRYIYEGTFSGCSGLDGNLVLHDKVTHIGKEAFSDCSGLSGDLVIPEGISCIYEGAFKNCSGFSGKLSIPKSVNLICEEAFSGCNGFDGSLIFKDYVYYIEDRAFYQCSNLEGTLNIPENTTSIGEEVFYECENFSDVYIPPSVTSIGDGAFALEGDSLYLSNAGAISSYVNFYAEPNSYPEKYLAQNGFNYMTYSFDALSYFKQMENGDFFHVYIQDADTKKPITKSVINGEIVENEDGYTYILLSEADKKGNITLQYTAEGYEKKTDTIKVSKNIPPVILELNSIEGAFKILSVEAMIGGKSTNLLSENLYLMQNKNGETLTDKMVIQVKTRGTAEKYTLLQDKKVIATSKDGKFEIPIKILEGKSALTNLEKNGSYEVIASDAEGNQSQESLGIRVWPYGFYPEEEDGFALELGEEELVFTVPEGVPFFGEKEMKCEMPELPIEIEVATGEEGEQIRIAVGKVDDEPMDKFKEAYEQLADEAKVGSKIAGIMSDTTGNKLSKGFGAGFLEPFEVNIMGYGEAIFEPSKDNEEYIYQVDVGIVIAGAVEGAYTQYFYITSVPVYVAIEGGIEVGGEVSISFGTKEGNAYGLGEIETEASLNVEGGVGIEDLLSVGAAGTGEFHWNRTPQKTVWRDEIWLKGWWDINVDIAVFSLKLMESKKARYDIYPQVSRSLDEVSLLSIEEQMYDTSSYKLMDRTYLQRSEEEVSTAEIGSDFVQTYVYPGASPKLIKAGEKLYLFWLQDIATRSAENRAALVYSFSTDGENWSVPQQIIEESKNQTLDNSFDLYVLNEKIYICWQEATEILRTGISLDEMLQKTQIAYAVLDCMTGEVIEEKIITSEEGCYIQPKICAKDDKVVITWVKNEAAEGKSILESGNLSKLMIYDSSKDSISYLDLGKQRIMSLDIDFNDGKCGMLYALDEDGNLLTEEDRYVVYDTGYGENEEERKLLSEKENCGNTVIEDGICYWYGDDNIHYVEIGESECKTVYPEAMEAMPCDFEVVSEGTQTTILWNSINLDTEQVSLYGIRKEEEKWTAPFVIQHTDSYMTNVISGEYKEEELYLSYLHIQALEDGSKCHSIDVVKEKAYEDIALEYVIYDSKALIPGEALTLTAKITNLGNRKINSVNVLWDGKFIGTQEADLAVGESKEIEISSYCVPENLTGFEKHKITVRTEEEQKLTDNSYDLGIGYTELEVECKKRIQDGRTYVDVTIANNSHIPTNCTLNLRADEKKGEILLTEDLGEIGANKVVFLSLDLRKFENYCCTYFVEAVPENEDNIKGNNRELVFTGFGRDVPIGKLTSPATYYTVRFEYDGEEICDSEKVDEGSRIREPQEPVRNGYHFDGWYLNGEPYDFSTPVTSDITLEAHWREYDTLISPSANIPSGSEVAAGTKLVLTCAAGSADIYYTTDGSEPTRTSSLYQEPIEITENMIVKAFAVAKGYKDSEVVSLEYRVAEAPLMHKVVFDSKGGSDVADLLVENGEKISVPEAPVKEGYQFEGWYLNGSKYDFNTLVTSDITLEAHWKEVNDGSGENKPDDGTGDSKPDDGSGENKPDDGTGENKPDDGTGENKPDDGIGEVAPEDIPEGGIEAIPEGLWIAGIEKEGYTYTGKAMKPEVRVYDHTTLLEEKKDYTISYSKNVNVSDLSKANKTPTIIIKGKGNYAGKEKAVFEIVAKSISGNDIVADDIYKNYNKKQQKPIPIVMDNGKKLTYKKHFTVEYVGITENGDAFKEVSEKPYKILIHGTGNYSGTKEINFTITNKNLLNKAKIQKIKNQNYTGEKITPEVKVMYKGETLKQDTDYKVEYKDNCQVGTATVHIIGMGNFIGERTVYFKITGTNIKNAQVSNIPTDITYTGKAITTASEEWKEAPILKVWLKGEEKELKPGEKGDYTIRYEKNEERGTAAIIFTGVNGFTGTLKKTFKIVPFDMENDEQKMLTIEMESKTFYAKGGSKPKPIIKLGNKVLREGKDYTLSYQNHTKLNDGKDKTKLPTVTIKGKGNFKGTKTLNYTIEKQDISVLNLVLADKVYQKKAGAFKFVPKVKDLNGKLLKAGIDYEKDIIYTYKKNTTVIYGQEEVVRKAGDEVDLKDIVPAGTTICVTITGMENYKSENVLQGEYRVVQADINKASVKIAPQTYTGKEIKPDKDLITVKVKGVELTPEDYDIVSYNNNVKKGKASITICGKGNYGGVKNTTFNIKSKLFLWWQK